MYLTDDSTTTTTSRWRTDEGGGLDGAPSADWWMLCDSMCVTVTIRRVPRVFFLVEHKAAPGASTSGVRESVVDEARSFVLVETVDKRADGSNDRVAAETGHLADAGEMYPWLRERRPALPCRVSRLPTGALFALRVVVGRSACLRRDF